MAHSLEDLEAIGDFIARENPARAATFIDDLLGVCSHIAKRPQAYQKRDDLAQGLRQAIHGRYLVLLTCDADGVVIERVLHGARRIEGLL